MNAIKTYFEFGSDHGPMKWTASDAVIAKVFRARAQDEDLLAHWRLPTVQELKLLARTNIFRKSEQHQFWSCESHDAPSGIPASVKAVSMQDGSVRVFQVDSNEPHLMLVRSYPDPEFVTAP